MPTMFDHYKFVVHNNPSTATFNNHIDLQQSHRRLYKKILRLQLNIHPAAKLEIFLRMGQLQRKNKIF